MVFLFLYVDMEPCQPQSDSFEALNHVTSNYLSQVMCFKINVLTVINFIYLFLIDIM